ncbi:MAG: DUF4013 domain-containing protein [Pseudomonadota bacterium]
MITAFFDTFRWPFREADWQAKVWPLPLIAFIPLIDLITFEGWRMMVVKRMAKGESPLPAFDIGAKLAEGITIVLCRATYVLVPVLISNLTGVGGLIGRILDLFLLASGDGQAIGEDFVSDLAYSMLIIVVWYVISAPIFHCGMIRYALSGDWKCLLNVPANLMLFLGHVHYFILFYIYAVVAAILIVFVAIALTITAVGVVLVPIAVFCLYYTMSAYEIGELAQKIGSRRAARAAKRLEKAEAQRLGQST